MGSSFLSEENRRFFGLVARAAFGNPFSEERTALERGMVESTGEGSEGLTDEALRNLAIEAVRHRLLEITPSTGDRTGAYRGVDRQLVRTALLFDLFHRHIDDFDGLTEEQAGASAKSCSVPFAGDIVDDLESSGFTHEESLRYLGFFFQLRRAFFFIHRGLVGESPSMRELRRQLWNCVFTSDIRWYEQFLWNRMEDFSTLLFGETGTGKGTAAAAIGRSIFIPFDEKSGCFEESFARNFVSINLSRFPETIIESELFGHKKGAFTGAIDHYEGVFSRCSSHGAIFLDEIGDVSPHVQLKLLQVLQERTFSPVGSHEARQFRGRVIAATNRSPGSLRRKGGMRDDFYYRLCSNTITVPPLRTRIAETPRELDLLLDHLLRRILGARSPRMVGTIRRILHRTVGPGYPWPGNVRELEQAVRRILLTRRYEGDTGREREGGVARLLDAAGLGEAGAYEILSAYCVDLFERHGTIEAVARITKLDRRTVKKYIEAASPPPDLRLIGKDTGNRER